MKKDDKRKYKKAFSDSLLIISFTMMPTLFSGLLICWGSDKGPFSNLYGKGELFIYSISFLGSAYVIYKQLNNDLFKNWGNTIVALLFLISTIYSAAALDFPNKPFDIIFNVSLVFLAISITFLFYSQVISNKEESPDIRGVRKDEQTKIENALD